MIFPLDIIYSLMLVSLVSYIMIRTSRAIVETQKVRQFAPFFLLGCSFLVLTTFLIVGRIFIDFTSVASLILFGFIFMEVFVKYKK